ncbi:hypothetical protein [uncultured Deinococcus sp.]|uniref:hypothetical protein n=1 Tax=uncultured Deinococcus sp. TaxID=158789 RepID=UPI0025EC9C4D|nr:hypothetical protein [uncultured Deinococcus sp.]
MAELYHLVYDHFDTGGLEFQLVTPEPIRQAIYRLDHDLESTDPIYGWAKMPTLERHLYLQKRMKHELTQALDQIGG